MNDEASSPSRPGNAASAVRQTGQSAASAVSLVPFRIFLASPGDVAHERRIARQTVEKLRSERRFRGRLDLQVVAWDSPGAAVAVEAGQTPQMTLAEGLLQPKDCDLVLVVLWSHMGTPLPVELRKADGTRFQSGTEWEYENALEGFRARGTPRIWIYRRTEAPSIPLDDPDREEKIAQWDGVRNFVGALTNPDGSLAGGVNRYGTPEQFRELLEQHLRDHLELTLQHSAAPTNVPGEADAAQRSAPSWAGVPYPGLEAFTPELAPIFFGRDRQLDELVARMSDPKCRVLAVVGVSGSGKSSLVAAGLVRALRDGVIGDVPWLDLRFTPAERGTDPYLGLAYPLKALLGTTGETEQALAMALRGDGGRLGSAVAALLEGRPASAELLIVIDQFEELFTSISNQDRYDFLELLSVMSEMPRLRVVLTLRADFYARAIEEPVLAALLRRDAGTYPLGVPDRAALRAMIVGPAEAAGLSVTDELVEQILSDG